MAQIQVDTLLAKVMQLTRECPIRTAIGAYVDAARLLCDRSRWLVANVLGVTAIGTEVYVLDLASTGDTFNEIIGIQAMSITENATSEQVMTESFSGGWNPNPLTGGNALPELFQYVPEGQVAFSRKPDGVYSFRANVVLQPKRDSVSVDSRLVGVWDYALDAGALAYLLALPRTPWTDKAEAREQGRLFNGWVNQAASSAMRGYNAGARNTDRLGRSSGGVRVRVSPF